MPKIQKPGTSAEHQRAYDAAALKRVKKLLKSGNSFAGEEDRVLRVRDEYLLTLNPTTTKPTLSAAEADELVANLPTGPRSGITLRGELPTPRSDFSAPASRQPTPISRQPTPTLSALLPTSLPDSPRNEAPLRQAPSPEVPLRRAPSPEPLETSTMMPLPEDAAPQASPSSSSDESSVQEAPRQSKRVRTPTPPTPPLATRSMFEDDSDTDSGTLSPTYYRSKFELPATEKTAVLAFDPPAPLASSLYEKRTSTPHGGVNPRKLKAASPPASSEIVFSPILETPQLAPPTQVYTPATAENVPVVPAPTARVPAAAPPTLPKPPDSNTTTYASDRLTSSAHTPTLSESAGRISQISVADRYDKLTASITPAAAETFHRQVYGGIYRLSPACDAISGRARNDVTLRLLSDTKQLYVSPQLIHAWWDKIDCALLADIVLHYFGPQVDKDKTSSFFVLRTILHPSRRQHN